MLEIAWMIPLFPLLAFLLLVVGRRVLGEKAAAWIGSLAVFASLALSLGVLTTRISGSESHLSVFPWLRFGETVVHFGIEVGHLNALMLLIVSLVSFLVHVYSAGYMKGDERVPAFYAYLGLFTFSMLGLVLSPNLLQLYIFWELVGVCSFLLIGFWYVKPQAKQAAKKAFIMTRIGDIGLFIAMLMLFWQTGSLDLSRIVEAVQGGEIPSETVTWAALLILVGAVGKSGQFPLHTWLPDAMEGPTPVSALIHAATMVAAGVYLVARTFPLFDASPVAMDAVAYVGAFTAVFAATIALTQNDIKRVLAYSTVSQLGFMMFALGSAGYVAGVFHLMTHAFFKALLFLGAGAVMVALRNQQDIRKMGGLWSTHKGVGWLFLIGCLAIAGIPPFSGFFSKDEILMTAYLDGRMAVFVLGLVAAFFTAFYMFRLFFLVFAGEKRDHGKVEPVPTVMIWPMGVLAVLAVVAGFVEYPVPLLSTWLTKGVPFSGAPEGEGQVWIPVIATLVSVAGIFLAWAVYVKQALSRDQVRKGVPWVYQVVANRYYVDEFYQGVILLPYKGLSLFLRGFDRWVVAGLVRMVSRIFWGVGRWGAALQNGQVQAYALVGVIGLVLIIVGLTAGRLLP